MTVKYITGHHGIVDLVNGDIPKRIVKMFSSTKWEFEDSSLAHSFNNYEWYHHSTGCNGLRRVSIVDEVVYYKYSTGSGVWIYFDNVESALAFWKTNVDLPIMPCLELQSLTQKGLKHIFNKHDKVLLQCDSYSNWGQDEIFFHNENRQFRVDREIINFDTMEIRICITIDGARPYYNDKEHGCLRDLCKFSVPSGMLKAVS